MKRALEQVYESGQTLIVRRLDLLVEEARLLIQDAALRFIGCLIALLGWTRLMNGSVEWLSQRMPHPGAETLVGALHVALGAGLLWFARERARKAWRER